ncbi:unnamed protein product [Protopolystoma xenopodis]|uniref:Uncharacterized protein n=1 Tax=Protopolystoma xenopodis TaxID=117903 RepID=A0A448WGF8_9PLAT|nr:unnamed protein product [Protopolystoma xenopodis]
MPISTFIFPILFFLISLYLFLIYFNFGTIILLNYQANSESLLLSPRDSRGSPDALAITSNKSSYPSTGQSHQTYHETSSSSRTSSFHLSQSSFHSQSCYPSFSTTNHICSIPSISSSSISSATVSDLHKSLTSLPISPVLQPVASSRRISHDYLGGDDRSVKQSLTCIGKSEQTEPADRDLRTWLNADDEGDHKAARTQLPSLNNSVSGSLVSITPSKSPLATYYDSDVETWISRTCKEVAVVASRRSNSDRQSATPTSRTDNIISTPNDPRDRTSSGRFATFKGDFVPCQRKPDSSNRNPSTTSNSPKDHHRVNEKKAIFLTITSDQDGRKAIPGANQSDTQSPLAFEAAIHSGRSDDSSQSTVIPASTLTSPSLLAKGVRKDSDVSYQGRRSRCIEFRRTGYSGSLEVSKGQQFSSLPRSELETSELSEEDRAGWPGLNDTELADMLADTLQREEVITDVSIHLLPSPLSKTRQVPLGLSQSEVPIGPSNGLVNRAQLSPNKLKLVSGHSASLSKIEHPLPQPHSYHLIQHDMTQKIHIHHNLHSQLSLPDRLAQKIHSNTSGSFKQLRGSPTNVSHSTNQQQSYMPEKVILLSNAGNRKGKTSTKSSRPLLTKFDPQDWHSQFTVKSCDSDALTCSTTSNFSHSSSIIDDNKPGDVHRLTQSNCNLLRNEPYWPIGLKYQRTSGSFGNDQPLSGIVLAKHNPILDPDLQDSRRVAHSTSTSPQPTAFSTLSFSPTSRPSPVKTIPITPLCSYSCEIPASPLLRIPLKPQLSTSPHSSPVPSDFTSLNPKKFFLALHLNGPCHSNNTITSPDTEIPRAAAHIFTRNRTTQSLSTTPFENMAYFSNTSANVRNEVKPPFDKFLSFQHLNRDILLSETHLAKDKVASTSRLVDELHNQKMGPKLQTGGLFGSECERSLQISEDQVNAFMKGSVMAIAIVKIPCFLFALNSH